MIKSMTGYGKAEAQLESGKISIEIRSLNGKNADISIKSQLLPKDKELSLRQKIARILQRGTIDVFISYEANSAEGCKTLNCDAIKAYYLQMKEIREALPGLAAIDETKMNNDLLSAVLRLPDVIDVAKKEIITQENWPLVEEAFDKALEAIDNYRKVEGEALHNDVSSRVRRILELENEVESSEGERIETVKTKILKNLEELAQKPDQSRFEQELVFYLEKMDINEEKVRLRQHCSYFLDTLEAEPYPGKKLGFIIQEMGREINTTGSKANHAGIQKAVVMMKDELEKIREQSMNIL